MSHSYVMILKCKRHNGGFATTRTDCWEVILVRNNVQRKICVGLNEYAVYSKFAYANEMAIEWATFLGWPIRKFEEQETVTMTQVEIS